MPFIFVYGNLKKGFGPHARHMQSARFITTSETDDCAYRLIAVLDTDATGPYPALLDDGDLRIKGEVYEIDERLLMRLDAYEGNGYERREIRLKENLRAQVYFFVNPDNLPMTAEHPQICTHGDPPDTAEWTTAPS